MVNYLHKYLLTNFYIILTKQNTDNILILLLRLSFLVKNNNYGCHFGFDLNLFLMVNSRFFSLLPIYAISESILWIFGNTKMNRMFLFRYTPTKQSTIQYYKYYYLINKVNHLLYSTVFLYYSLEHVFYYN